MRENRSSGSEGGVALIPPSLPLSNRYRAWVGAIGQGAWGVGLEAGSWKLGAREVVSAGGRNRPANGPVLLVLLQPQRGCSEPAQGKRSAALG